MAVAQEQGNSLEKALVKAFDKKFTHSAAKVAKANEYAKSLEFDRYEEETTSGAMRGIKEENFECVVNSIASAFDIPDNKRKAIIAGRYAEEGTDQTLHKFCCQTDGDNKFLFGIILTRMNNGKFDLIYSVYSLDFGFAPHHVERPLKKEFKLLGFTLASWCSTEYVPKAKVLSQSNQDLLKVYFQTKAIEPYKR